MSLTFQEHSCINIDSDVEVLRIGVGDIGTGAIGSV